MLDSPSRENEGDMIIAAEDVTEEKMAFMVRHTSGLICSPLAPSVTIELQLPQMVLKNTEADGTAYTISVDCIAPGMTTGISAYDRAMTCRMLASQSSMPTDFRRPGHVFPLRARDGGVRERRGHTEATIEFCKLAGKRPVGALCELVSEGETVEGKAVMKGVDMMRAEGCLSFGRRWDIRVCTIDALVEYLQRRHDTNGVAQVNGI